MSKLDVITIGRSSVDLYGDQIGGRLEDMGSFSKYIGGSPTNMACGTARLGLRSGLITRVGDEHMGRFIREELVRRRCRCLGRRHRSRAADRAGDPGHSRRGQLSADLLPRELRRHGAGRRRHRPGLHRPVAQPGRHRHASFASAHRSRGAESAADRARQGPADRAGHRLSSEPVGRGGAWRGRKPFRRKRQGDGQAAGNACTCST